MNSNRHERIYQALLVCYPQAFRDEYGREMRLVFRDQLYEEGPTLLGVAALRFWARTLADLVASALRERAEVTLERRNLVRVGALAAMVGGVSWIVWVVNTAVTAARDPSPGVVWIGSVALVIMAALGVAVRLWDGAKLAAGMAAGLAVAAGGFLVGAAVLRSWPLLNAGFISFWVSFLLTAVFLLTDGRIVPRWLASALLVGALLLPLHNTRDWRLWLTLPLGLAWMGIGYALWFDALADEEAADRRGWVG